MTDPALPPPTIDPHHHLWDLERHYYPWLSDPMRPSLVGDFSSIRHSYLVADYLADIARQNIVKSVHLQAEYDPRDPVAETRWLQAVADDPRSRGFPHGIVAYADLSDPGVEAILVGHCAFANMRGIRQILNHHPNPTFNFVSRDYLEEPGWCANYGLLGKHGLSFDMQLYDPQMAAAAVLARRYPDIHIIINHTGTPVDRDAAGIDGWRRGMRLLAECPNVATKISGLGMADHRWTVESIRPFIMETIEMFGVERCMFASNFPVDRMFSDYNLLWNAFRAVTAGFTAGERAALFHDNAARFYRL
jgi:predicted TIM-barrel fold metal-dependent hydrolase